MEFFVAGMLVVNVLAVRKALAEAWETYKKEQAEKEFEESY